MHKPNLTFFSCIVFALLAASAFCQEAARTEIISNFGVVYNVTLSQAWVKTSDEGGFKKADPESTLFIEANPMPSLAETDLQFKSMLFNDLKNKFSDLKQDAASGNDIKILSEDDKSGEDEPSYMIGYRLTLTTGDKIQTQFCKDLLFTKGSLLYIIRYTVMAEDEAVFNKEWQEVESIKKSINVK